MTRGIRDTGEVGDGGTFPMDLYEIRKLKGLDRAEAMRKYHKWLKEQRKEDKRLAHNKINRSYIRESIDLKRKHNIPSGVKSRCLDCGKKISKYGFRCMKCNAKVQTGRIKAKVTGSYGGKGSGTGRGKKPDLRTKKMRKMKKKASTTFWFLIAMTILIVAYILALPPEFRRILLS